MLTRRELARLAAGGLLAGTALPRPARASRPDERRFLFVFCSGGWDTTYCFTPMGPNGVADVEPDHAAATVNGLRFVDVEARPDVRRFMERWGDQTCIINGMEVPSVAHERCSRLVLTGRAGDADDWPSIIASASANSLTLPHVVMDGLAYNSLHASQVVRVGDVGQLPLLLGPDAFQGQAGVAVPSRELEALEDAWVQGRVSDLAARAGGDAQGRFLAEYQDALADLTEITENPSVDLGVSYADCERDLVADAATLFDCFEQGLSRCGMIRYNGWCGESWDQHQGIQLQSVHFNDLFGYLDRVLADLDARWSPSGAPLREEVTVVVFSEMGRAPMLNSWGGKDHWTFTSAMLIGSGVLGGQVIGEVDDGLRGAPVDLDSGAAVESGVTLGPEHLGATLLRLADIDPAEHIADGAPLLAALSRP